MVWRIWGRGPTNLVLFHGNFGAWTHWIRNVAVLSAQFRVIVPDIPGFGDSAEPPNPYSAESLAAIIANGLAAITGDTVALDVVGFSFGTVVATEVVRVLGRRVRKFVLVSSGRNMEGVVRGKLAPLVKWRELPTRELRDAAHRRNLEVIMIADPSRVDNLAVFIQSTNAEQTRLKSAIIGESASHRTCTPYLKCELAAIWAERDATIGPYLDQRPAWLHKHHPQARYIIISDAGHWCNYEAHEQFNRMLPDLLDPGSSADTAI